MENEKCIICGTTENLESIFLREDRGWMSQAGSEHICKKCYKDNIKLSRVGCFITINDNLYYGDPWGSFDRVFTENQLYHIFNTDYCDLLKYVD